MALSISASLAGRQAEPSCSEASPFCIDRHDLMITLLYFEEAGEDLWRDLVPLPCILRRIYFFLASFSSVSSSRASCAA